MIRVPFGFNQRTKKTGLEGPTGEPKGLKRGLALRPEARKPICFTKNGSLNPKPKLEVVKP